MSPPDEAALLALARARSEALVEMTRSLVRIDSQTPPSDTRAAAEAAAAMLADLPGVEVSLHESEAPVVNLVARLKGGTPGARLILSGHLDTYPIGHRAAWTHDPLGGEVAEGRLWGRGSADMKGGVAVLIETLRLFALHMRPFAGEIVLALAGDEERMGELGTQWLIDHVPDLRGDAVLVADVGGPSCVRLGEKGMLWVDLEAIGRQAHGAHVHAGDNAADKLLAALADLRAVEASPFQTPASAAGVIAAAASHPRADGPEARAVMTRPTMNIGVIASGESSNLVPARAAAGVDIRIPLGLSAGQVEAFVAETLRRHPSVSATVTRSYEPSWTAPAESIAQAALGAAQVVAGADAFMDMRIGGSDARLWRRAGMPTVVLGLTPHNLGGPDENLEVDELPALLGVYCLAMRRFLEGA